MIVFCFFEDWEIASQEWFVISYWVASPRTLAMTFLNHYDPPSRQIPLLMGLQKASFQSLEKIRNANPEEVSGNVETQWEVIY